VKSKYRVVQSHCLVLQALGVEIDLGPEGIAACVREAGVGFMYAPRYHPAMKAVRPVRSALKVRQPVSH
jgi:anthranilate phosphoribosyltransferase